MCRVRLGLIVSLLVTLPVCAQRGGGGGRGASGGIRGGGFSGMRRGGVARGGGSGAGGFRSNGFVHRPLLNSRFRFNRFPRTAIFPFFYGGLGFYDSFPYSYSDNPYT